MSTVVEEVKEIAKSPNGVVAAPERAVPRFPLMAAPFAAAAAAMLAVWLARRRREPVPPKAGVYWSFRLASGNHINFHPVLAPRMFVRGRGRPAGRRFFRR